MLFVITSIVLKILTKLIYEAVYSRMLFREFLFHEKIILCLFKILKLQFLFLLLFYFLQ